MLINEYRGEVLENVHAGRICVVGANSGGGARVLYRVGDIAAPTFYRSASKPIQALPVIMLGLDKKYGLNARELAIMAGSHAGERMHLETILSLLEKTGFSESDLIMNPVYPAEKNTLNEYIRKSLAPRKALHNCAGKHIAAMTLSKHFTGDHRRYWQPDGAAQTEIARRIAEMSEHPVEKIMRGIDGCGVPVFAVPLKNIAISYLRLAAPDTVANVGLMAAIKTLTPVMNEQNLMIRGTGYLCSVINEDKNIVAKGGAQGVYGFGLKKERLGVSIKIEDGSENTWPIIIAEILRQLSYDGATTIKKLENLAPREIRNDNDATVGRIETAFTLEPAGKIN